MAEPRVRLGIVSNRFSDGNGGNLDGKGRIAIARPGTLFAAPDSRAEIPAHLRRFAEAGVDVLAIDGGDGTVRDVVSAIPETFGDRWPPIALLPSGKTNVIARDVGGFGKGTDGLVRLFARLDHPGGNTSARRCLQVTWPGEPGRIAHGFVLGAGVYSHATRMAGAWSHDRGIKQGAAVALILARVLAMALAGRSGDGTAALGIGIGEAPPPAPTPHFLMMATSLERMMLGLWPFPEAGEGSLHWLALAAPPRGLVRHLWRAWRGNLAADPARGLAGGRADALSLALDAPFVLDGELYQPGPGGVAVRSGPLLSFLRP